MKRKYKIISAGHEEALERKVNEAIEEGWLPIGGPAINGDTGDGFDLLQAMVNWYSGVLTYSMEDDK